MMLVTEKSWLMATWDFLTEQTWLQGSVHAEAETIPLDDAKFQSKPPQATIEAPGNFEIRHHPAINISIYLTSHHINKDSRHELIQSHHNHDLK